MPPHDTLWKTLLQTFFLSLLRLVAPELEPPDRFVFLDKELFPKAPGGERREADLLARLFGPGGTLLVHLEVEARHRERIWRRLEQYYHLLQARYAEPVYSVLLTLRGGPGGIQKLSTRRASPASAGSSSTPRSAWAVWLPRLCSPRASRSPGPSPPSLLAEAARRRPASSPASTGSAKRPSRSTRHSCWSTRSKRI
jgi:hypothetical protein